MVTIGSAANVSLTVNQTLKIDTDGDGTDDIEVTLTGFDSSGKPQFTGGNIQSDIQDDGDKGNTPDKM